MTTPEQKAYIHFWYEGFLERIQLIQTMHIHGHDSMEARHADAMNEANAHLAYESLKEITDPVARAGWQGWIDGRVQVKVIGDPEAEANYPRTVPDANFYQRTIPELFYDELDGWMVEFYTHLPLIVELILDKGIRHLEHQGELAETWSFFPNIAEGVDESTGNFGDGFTDMDRHLINEYVKGDMANVARAVRDSMAIKGGRTWRTPDDC